MENNRSVLLTCFEQQKNLINSRLDATIESVRKGFCSLQIKDSEGKPIENATVRVKQKTHAFRYGANLFMLDELESDEKNKTYKKLFKDAFNMATLPFYWCDLEPERGSPRYAKDSPKVYRRPSPDLCLEFCEQNGIEPREHALAYDYFFPNWLRDKSVRECKFALEKRFAEIAERYAHRIGTIEVTNEMFWPRGQEKTALFREPNFVEFCFKLAEKYFPHNQLVINEYSMLWNDAAPSQRPYLLQIENVLARGARIDAIGMQYHNFRKKEEEHLLLKNRYNPFELYYTMDSYAQLGKPLQITEVTVPAFSKNQEDEAIQADLIEQLYRVWFSHESVEQIIYWNLIDGYAAFAEKGDMTAGENLYHGGLVRFDLTPKPAYFRIKELFEKVWHTEGQALHSYEGNYEFKGFFGDYEATVVHDGKTKIIPFSLKKALGGKDTVSITI